MMPRSTKRLLAGLAALMLLIASVSPLTAFGEETPLPETSLESSTPSIETSPSPSSESESSSTPPESTSDSSGDSSSDSSGDSSQPEVNLPPGISGLDPDGILAVNLLPYNYCNVSADVSFDAVNPANGDLIVTLKLEKLDLLGRVTAVRYQTLRYTDGMGSRNFQFLDLPSGRYRLTQLPVLRYRRQSLTPSSVSGNIAWLEGYSVTFNLSWWDVSGYAAFHNKRTTDSWLTHTDMVMNRIYLPAGGGDCNDEDKNTN